MTEALKWRLTILVGALIIAMFAPASSLPREDADQAKLDAYVAVAMNSTQFIAEWRRLIVQADSEEQAAAFSAYVNQRIIAMIDATPDITFAEYQDISNALKSDPMLKERLTRIVRQRYGS